MNTVVKNLFLVLIQLTVASFAFAQVFSPVSPEQVPSGMEYNVIQPKVEDAHLFDGKVVAILASNGVEESEIVFPYEYLKNRGAKVEVIVPSWSKEGIVASKYLKPTLWVKADATFGEAINFKYDLLVLTGGAWNAQVVRSDSDAIKLVTQHYKNNGPIAAICAGTLVLIDSGLSKNKTLTGSPVVRIDLENSGAHYLNQALVVSENIATSRSPADLESFVEGLKTLLIDN